MGRWKGDGAGGEARWEGRVQKGGDGKLQLGCNILKNNGDDNVVVEVMMMMIKDRL